MNLSEIVKVVQLPEIYSKLDVIGSYIDDYLKDIDNLECTEENKQMVKKRRTEINNTLKLMETRRKEIKKAIEEPYNQFETKYKTQCAEKLSNASEILGEKIKQIEDGEREEKRKELMPFFEQQKEYFQLEDIVTFEDMGLNITTTGSIKSLKEQIMKTCERIGAEINLINQDEYREEILLEYKQNKFNYAKAKLDVENRHHMIDSLKQENEKKDQQREEDQVVIDNVETLVSTPKPIVTEKTFDFTLHFKNVTEKEVTLMKAFFESEGIEYSD